MGVGPVHVLAQWAGATAFIAALGCIIAAALGMQFASEPFAPAADAFRLARLLALLGGAAVIVAGAASTFYWWRVGVASDAAAAAVGCGITGAAVVFAVAARALLHRARRTRP
jgi:hypothetical protein